MLRQFTCMSRKKAIRKLDEQIFSFVQKLSSEKKSFSPLSLSVVDAKQASDTKIHFQRNKQTIWHFFVCLFLFVPPDPLLAHIYAASMMKIVLNSCGFPEFFRRNVNRKKYHTIFSCIKNIPATVYHFTKPLFTIL